MFWDFSGNYAIWNAFWTKIATFSDFEKFQVFFQNNLSFFDRNPNFEQFENS